MKWLKDPPYNFKVISSVILNNTCTESISNLTASKRMNAL